MYDMIYGYLELVKKLQKCPKISFLFLPHQIWFRSFKRGTVGLFRQKAAKLQAVKVCTKYTWNQKCDSSVRVSTLVDKYIQ